MPKGIRFEEELLDAFAASNAVFNAWPYFRELVQSSMARMGLPPVVVPLLRIGDLLADEGDESDAVPAEDIAEDTG